MKKESLTDFLKSHEGKNPVAFHMPGHKGKAFFDEVGKSEIFNNIANYDITEILGADNLLQPESVIAQIMEKYRKLYDCRESFLLVNGSSAGIIGAILTCVSRGEKLILAGNSHKSVISGLTLAGGIPIYVQPEFDEKCGVSGCVNPDVLATVIKDNPDAKAVLITSPNYYGICSDIAKISEIAHEAGMLLIVDQAHGAHLRFFEKYGAFTETDFSTGGGFAGGLSACGGFADGLSACGGFAGGLSDAAGSACESDAAAGPGPGEGPGAGAENCEGTRGGVRCFDAGENGADIVIMSTHKTLASFTQTALANVYSQRVDLSLLADMIHMVQSSSPSYLLMMSLDVNADILIEDGERLTKCWLANIENFKRKAVEIPFVNIMENEMLDVSKINIDMAAGGIDGNELEKRLMKRNIFVELTCGNMVMAMTGIGNSEGDYEKLLKALREISGELVEAGAGSSADCVHKACEEVSAGGECAGRLTEKLAGVSAGSSADCGQEARAGASAQAKGCEAVAALVEEKGRKLKLSHDAQLGAAAGKVCEIPRKRVSVHYKEAAGMVCASAIIPYPPGIPIVLPGEQFDEERLEYAFDLRTKGLKVLGMDAEGYVMAGK